MDVKKIVALIGTYPAYVHWMNVGDSSNRFTCEIFFQKKPKKSQVLVKLIVAVVVFTRDGLSANCSEMFRCQVQVRCDRDLIIINRNWIVDLGEYGTSGYSDH